MNLIKTFLSLAELSDAGKLQEKIMKFIKALFYTSQKALVI
jgi:hypothetical protein